MAGLMGLLITVVILCLVAYLIFWALAQIPLPEPIRVIVTVLITLVLLVWIVQRFALLAGV